MGWVRDLSHSNSLLLGASGTDPEALGAALPPPAGKVTGGMEILPGIAGRCPVQSRSPQYSAQRDLSTDPQLPLLPSLRSLL